MPTTEKRPFNIHDYLEIGLRRKWYIVLPLVSCTLISFGIYKYLPSVYRATTLILVQAQSIPESFVRSTIPEDFVANRLDTISQEILSRTRLEKVIREFNLYGDLGDKVPMEVAIEKMKKAIQVKVQKGKDEVSERKPNSFTVSFEGGEPKTVMMVTNRLASLCIEENLKVRALEAEETSEFFSKELLHIDDQLKLKEQEVRAFREKNMGQLPQQIEANLRIFEQLRQQLQTVTEKEGQEENRRMILGGQIEHEKRLEAQYSALSNLEDPDSHRVSEDPLIQLLLLKKELTIAQTRIKETHPDIIELKRKIAVLESELEVGSKAEREEKGKAGGNLTPPKLPPGAGRGYNQPTEQYNSSVLETKRLKEEERNLKEQMALYKKRIEDTPKREQELVLLTRDYDQLKANYQSLLDKKMQAQMAENLERRQKGVQFKILEPADLPGEPVKPNRNKILFIGAWVGLVMGLGLTWFRESLDQSFRTAADLEDYLEIPVLARVPNLRRERKAA